MITVLEKNEEGKRINNQTAKQTLTVKQKKKEEKSLKTKKSKLQQAFHILVFEEMNCYDIRKRFP